MTKQLRFEDHNVFQRQVMRLTVGAASLSLAGYLLGALWAARQSMLSDALAGYSADLARFTVLTLVAAGLGVLIRPLSRAGLWRRFGLALLISGIGTLLMLAVAPRYPYFGFAIYGAALGVVCAAGLRDHRRFTVPLALAVSVPLATWVTTTFAARLGLSDYVPEIVAESLLGAMFGFLVSIGLVTRQLRLEHDRVLEAYETIKDELAGEMEQLTQRAIATYRRIDEGMRDRGESEADQKLAKRVESLMLKIIALGRRWQEVERQSAKTSHGELADRVAELDTRIATTKDDVARGQYQRAREALAAQLGYLDDIAMHRERVTARVHNYLAALQRIQLAVLNHRGADAAKFSDELQPILDELDDIGSEIDIASEAISDTALVGATRPSDSSAPAV